ncbi:MAG TPA: AMP-binding protein, partial [Limnochordales bacterium]
MQPVGFWLSKRSEMHPERIALTVPGGDGYVNITYAALNRRVNRLARALRSAGLSRGDRVSILSLNCLEFVELLFAAAKAGLIVVPLNVRLAVPEWRYQLADSGARLLLVGPEFAGHAAALQEGTAVERVIPLPAPGETGEYGQWLAAESDAEPELPAGEPPITIDERFIICYTSGTTGKPKGAVLTQGNQWANALNSCMTLDISGRDTTITLLPMFHVGGIGLFTLPTLYAGGRVVIPRRFDPGEALHLIETQGVTIVFGVPTIHQALLQHPNFDKTDFRHVRYFYSGGAPCPLDLIRAFQQRGLAFGQGYGLTETSPVHFLMVPEDFERKAGSVGRPGLHAEARIVDAGGQELPPGQVGEVVVR